MKRESAKHDRIGLYGDFWTLLLLTLLRILPLWFCAAMTWPLATIFYCLAHPQRRALIANQRALRRQAKPVTLWFGGYCIFVQFALTYLDRLACLHFGRPIQWVRKDLDELTSRLAKPGGVLLFVAHSGNFDIGAQFCAVAFSRPIHVVRVAERTEALQRLRAAELDNAEKLSSHFRVHYVGDEWSLGVELLALLQAGEVVAIQADRVVQGSAYAILENEGARFRLPKGPWVLAQASRVPCFAVFLTRVERCKYRLQSGPAFYDGDPSTGAVEIGRLWLAQLAPFVRRHWDQWYLFDHHPDSSSNPGQQVRNSLT